MKIKSLIVATFILSSSILFAQDFSIGFHDGISIYGINGSFDFKNFDKTEISNRIGHNTGIIVNLKAASFLSLQLEMNYEENGFNFKNHHGLTGVGYKGNFKTEYISIPLTTIFEIGKNIKYYCYVGINLRLLLKADNYTSVSSTSEPVALHIYDLSYDPTFLFNKSEFGGLVGLGIKIPLCEKVKLLIDSRYNFGITKAAKNTEFDYNANNWTTDTPDNFQKVHNRSLVLSLGISYCFKSRNKNGTTKLPSAT